MRRQGGESGDLPGDVDLGKNMGEIKLVTDDEMAAELRKAPGKFVFNPWSSVKRIHVTTLDEDDDYRSNGRDLLKMRFLPMDPEARNVMLVVKVIDDEDGEETDHLYLLDRIQKVESVLERKDDGSVNGEDMT